MSLNKQDSEYAEGPICQNCEYGRVLNMQASHSVLNIPEYVMTEFWIYLRIYYVRILIMQQLHRFLNMPQYGWVCLTRTWIYLSMSEFTILDRFLNMHNTIYSVGLLYKLMSILREAYSELGQRWWALWKILTIFSKNLNLNLWEGSRFVSGFKYVNYERILNIPGFRLCQVSAYTSVIQGSE